MILHQIDRRSLRRLLSWAIGSFGIIVLIAYLLCHKAVVTDSNADAGQEHMRLQRNFIDYSPSSKVGDDGLLLASVPSHRCRVSPNERGAPPIIVSAQSLWVGVVEVTEEQWRSQFTEREEPSYRRVGPNSFPQKPMRDFTWCDAIEFSNRASEVSGLQKAYAGVGYCKASQGESVFWNKSANGFRLPTAQEWECSARAGTYARYWSGESENDLAMVDWYISNSQARTLRGGLRPPNPFGLYDVQGMLSEWVWDRCDSQTIATITVGWGARFSKNPQGAILRMVRGGNAWESAANAAIALKRCEPANSFGFRGLRVVRNMTDK